MQPSTYRLLPTEHQQLVLMTGSKKGWQTYLGLDDRTARSIWTELNLKAPAAYVRDLEVERLSAKVLALGHKKAAEHYGLSESGLKSILKERYLTDHPKKDGYDKQTLTDRLAYYKSVRFMARMENTTESWIREEAKRLDVDAKLLIDYSQGNNSNAKGRRAEQDWTKMRGVATLNDLNLSEGSQAPYDFDDQHLGRINVKSSRQYKYKASTRKASPHFWKASLNAAEKCDNLVILCYDDKMEILLGIHVLPSAAAIELGTRTVTLLHEQLEPPHKWNIS